MTGRQIGLAAAVTVAVIAAGAIFGGFLGATDPDRPEYVPPFPETRTDEPPPQYDRPATDEERITYWMGLLIYGDDEEVEWAKRQIRRGGEAARAAIVAAAKRSVRSNPAYLQQALDLLLEQPRPSDLPLARDALASRDPFVATRAASLLGAIGAPHAIDAAAQLGEAAATRENPVPRYAMAALARIGGPECARAAIDATGRMEPRWRGLGYVAVARIGGEEVLAFLRNSYEREKAPELRIAAAEGLLVAGDDTPRRWLRTELDRAAAGSVHAEAALAVLARAADPAAFTVLAERVRDTFDAPRAEQALELLEAYPIEQKVRLLWEATGASYSDEVRRDAWEALVRADVQGAFGDLTALLRSTGPDAAGDISQAALVLGRLRDRRAVPSLLTALGTLATDDDDLRVKVLRAIMLTGDPRTAEGIAKAMAEDTGEFGAGGVAFNCQQALGSVTPELRAALAPELLRALEGEWGAPRGTGLQHLMLAAGLCCGEEVAPVLEPLLEHEAREIRESAIVALSAVGPPGSESALRAAWHRRQDEYTRDILRSAIESMHFRAR